jgi:hypothetical protein
LKSKKKREKPSPLPVGPNLGPTPATSLSHTPALLRIRPIFGLLSRARQPAPHPALLSLTRRPHPSATRPLARSLPLTKRPRGSVASSSFHRPLTEVTSGRRLHPPLCHLAAQGSSAPLRPPPLDPRPRRYRPRRGVSSAMLCGINAGTVRLTGVRQAPPPPRPSHAYKRLAPSPSFHAPASATPLLPSPEHNSQSAGVVLLSGESFPPPPSPSLLVRQGIE